MGAEKRRAALLECGDIVCQYFHKIRKYIKNSQEYNEEELVQFYEKWTRTVNRQSGEDEAEAEGEVGGEAEGEAGGEAEGKAGGEAEGEAEGEEDGEHAGGPEDKNDPRTVFFKEAIQQCYKWFNRRERRAFYGRALHLLRFYKRRCESCHSIESKMDPQRLWDKLADLNAKIQRQDFVFMSQDEQSAVVEALQERLATIHIQNINGKISNIPLPNFRIPNMPSVII